MCGLRSCRGHSMREPCPRILASFVCVSAYTAVQCSSLPMVITAVLILYINYYVQLYSRYGYRCEVSCSCTPGCARYTEWVCYNYMCRCCGQQGPTGDTAASAGFFLLVSFRALLSTTWVTVPTGTDHARVFIYNKGTPDTTHSQPRQERRKGQSGFSFTSSVSLLRDSSWFGL